MAQLSSIEWTDATWNPVTGCTKISPGCKNCYAERMAKRLEAMGQARYRNGFAVTLHPDLLTAPLHWQKRRLVFVNSMSDLFHESVPLAYIAAVFATIERANWHVFQVLTKRDERLANLAMTLPWPHHLWMGVSVESRMQVGRIENLVKVPAAIRFLSIEPLLEAIPDIPLNGIDWVIVGGESGPGSRLMKPEWVRNIRDQCQRKGIPFFFKQWGGVRKASTGRILDGRTWDEMPCYRAATEDPSEGTLITWR